jgi:hypothetical protein
MKNPSPKKPKNPPNPTAEPAGTPKPTATTPEAAAETHVPPPPGGASGKPPGFMDAWRKASTHGWAGLSSEERGALVRGGVNAAILYRTVTGKGVVSGGDGMI